MTDTLIADFEADLATAAEQAKAKLVPSMPPASSLADVPLEPETFLELISHLAPKVIYCENVLFDARAEAEEKLDVSLDDEEMSEICNHPQLKKLLKQWSKHDGDVAIFVTGFASEGILHSCALTPPWMEDFESAAETTLVELAPLLEEARNAENRISPEIHALALQLAEHPAFNAPKVSREKRAYLAETLFPEASQRELLQIVDRATNVAWLSDALAQDRDSV